MLPPPVMTGARTGRLARGFLEEYETYQVEWAGRQGTNNCWPQKKEKTFAKISTALQ